MSVQSTAMALPPVRYSRPAIFLHWAIFLLVALAFFAIEIRGPRGSDSRTLWTGIHQWAGISILCLSVLRIIWRGVHGAPAAEATGSRLLTISARAVHWLLYVCLIAQPLLGILMTNLAGRPVTLLGTDWTITLVGAHEDLRHVVRSAHVLLGNTLYYVIGLHALAALFHQFFLRDGTLRKML